MAALRKTLSFSYLSKARSFYSCTGIFQNAVAAGQGAQNENVIKAAFDDSVPEPKKVSKAMKAYMERAKAHDNFIKQQLDEFNIGKRHLANMMGKDPEFFSQEDIDEAIRYLFPSGLYDPKARPMMKHPDLLYPKRKAAEFDMNGRPFNVLFYTSKPNYFKALNDVATKLGRLDKQEDKLMKQTGTVLPESNILSGSEWLPMVKMEQIFLEKLSEDNYKSLVNALERLGRHPCAHLEKDFIMQFRKLMTVQSELHAIPEIMRDESGRPFVIQEARRKWAKATVKVTAQGTGLIEINGHNLDNIPHRQGKEQILFPLQFTDLLGKVDIVATVSGGGHAGQAGAVRHGISMCLRAFVDSHMMERMRLAGLLSFDPRKRERKKPGQEGARRKFTWKRR